MVLYNFMKKTKKQIKEDRQIRYGATRIANGQKMAWISIQNKNGWSLGLALNKKTIWLRNTRFATRDVVEIALEKTKVVFVELKNSKDHGKSRSRKV